MIKTTESLDSHRKWEDNSKLTALFSVQSVSQPNPIPHFRKKLTCPQDFSWRMWLSSWLCHSRIRNHAHKSCHCTISYTHWNTSARTQFISWGTFVIKVWGLDGKEYQYCLVPNYTASRQQFFLQTPLLTLAVLIYFNTDAQELKINVELFE